ncbi:C2H2 type zinc-finger-domain-containing protein [Xylariaceae sp. FL1019]|nr:C2H2 type zinc-finger-domain-containing protein [Xylariaceae sp. FL1019]
MIGATTETAVTTITSMSLHELPDTTVVATSTTESSMDSRELPQQGTMRPFAAGQCLFCPALSPSFSDSVVHMQNSHNLFVPHQRHLIVSLESLFGYLHLVIFEYRECIHCGTAKATVQAVQQHMTGKGHCKIDILQGDSEYADFYDFSMPDSDVPSHSDDDEDGKEEVLEDAARSLGCKPQLVDEDTIRLPSGRIISRHSSAPSAPSSTHLRRRQRTTVSQLKSTLAKPNEQGSSEEDVDSGVLDTRLISKREKREQATMAYQLANLRANDRTSLMHMSAAEQHAFLAMQHRHEDKIQKRESRRRGKIDRKGNKNLYAYWHTETPVYQCG